MVGRTPARAPFSHCAHGFDAALYNGNSGSARRASLGEHPMTEDEKEKAKATAAAGVGAGVGTACGTSIGVPELAAQGVVTGLSAGLVIGVGAVAGANGRSGSSVRAASGPTW